MSTPGQQSPGASDAGTPVAFQQTTVINVGSHKSVAGAVVLALLFGPLGMIYATVVGAVVMFFVNVIVAIPTLGLGLLVTIPVGAIWAGVAASNHNSRLGTMVATQAIGSGAHAPSPPSWHGDPDGSGRLRYWDGVRWTEHFADHPEAEAAAAEVPQPAELAPAPTEPLEQPSETDSAAATREGESPTVALADETQRIFCSSCGTQIAAADRFCASCGASQDSAG